MNGKSLENDVVDRRTPEEILKLTVLQCRKLEEQSNQIVADGGDKEAYKEMLVEKAELVASLPQLVQESVKNGNIFPESEMEYLRSLAMLAKTAIEIRGDFGLSVLLMSLESKIGDPNCLEEMIDRLYPREKVEEGKKQSQFVEELTMGMSVEEFIGLLDKYLTEEDVEIFGGREIAAERLADSYPYLGIFAPFPATLSKESILYTVGSGMSEEEKEKVFEIGLKIDIFQDESEKSPGRVSVSESMIEKLGQFLVDESDV
jgi:hypothetical protein